MNCRSARKYLIEYGEKGARPRDGRLERHLEECPDCHQILDIYQTGLAAFKEERLPPNLDFTDSEWTRAIHRATTDPVVALAPARVRSLRPALTYALLAVLVVAAAQFGLRRFPWLVPIVENRPVTPGAYAPRPDSIGPETISSAVAAQPSALSGAEARFDRAAFRPPRPAHRTTTPPPTGDVPSLTWISQETGLKIAWFINENLKLED